MNMRLGTMNYSQIKFAGARKNDISKTFAIQQNTAVN